MVEEWRETKSHGLEEVNATPVERVLLPKHSPFRVEGNALGPRRLRFELYITTL